MFFRRGAAGCRACGTHAAQQELRPPGWALCRNVRAVGLTPHTSIIRSIIRLLVACCFLPGCAEQSPAERTGRGGSGDAAATSVPAPQADSDQKARVLAALRVAGTTDTNSAAGETPRIRFRTLAADSGFVFQRNDDMRGQRRILEVNGGGAAVLDMDADGWLDVFMTNGCRLPQAEDAQQTPGRLFRNLREMRFGDCSRDAGLMSFGFCCGCAVTDVDHDGFEDLYLTAIGGNQFWKNNGDGTFTERAAASGCRGNAWGASAAFGDLNGDGHADLYVANYLDVSETNPLLCPEPRSPDGYVGCTPAMFPGVADHLYLADGSGAWIDASAAIAAVVPFPGKALGVVIADLGGDRRPEIYVANDGQPNFLFVVDSCDVTAVQLKECATEASAALNEQGFAQASMGIAAEDFNRDGRTDLFLTHFYRDTNTLYLNQSAAGANQLLFQDATRASRLGLPSLSRLGFGVSGLDADNDGWNDLLVVNGHVDDRTWFDPEQSYRMPAQMFANRGDGTFRDVSADAGDWFSTPALGRAAAAGDLDRDGRPDVVVSNQLDPSVILRNESDSAAASLVLKLCGRSAPRSPIGARVQLAGVDPPLWRQLAGGGSYQAADAAELHLGGLENQAYQLRIEWPDGSVEELDAVLPGRWLIRQGDGVWELPL
ncbi:MAG: CRTAC1 family protein [Planctomycetota bacterium]